MNHVPVFHARSPAQAQLVRDWLEDNGIVANVIIAQPAVEGGLEIVVSDPVVYVKAEDLERAEEAIRQYETSVRSAENLDRMSEAEGLFGWPLCPVCDELRQATCQRCQYTGSEFDVRVDEGHALITCLSCNQITTVQQIDTCPFCQYRFEDGEEEQAHGSGTRHAQRDLRNESEPVAPSRSFWVLVAGILLLIAVVAGVMLLSPSGR